MYRAARAHLRDRFASPLAAQDAYPSRAVNVVVPSPPGGVADAGAGRWPRGSRSCSKQPFVVTNKPGAGGAVGMAQVAGSNPTATRCCGALVASRSFRPPTSCSTGQPAYASDQLVPIALLSSDPTVLVVRAESPWQTVKDFVDDARRRPARSLLVLRRLRHAAHGMEMFAGAADIKLRHVPFNGGGPAVTALLGGHVDALASGPLVVLPQVKAGKLRALAGWGDKRVDAPARRADLQGARLQGRRVLHLGGPVRARRHARSRSSRRCASRSPRWSPRTSSRPP